MIDEDLQYSTKHMCFSFNVDEPAEVIYEELESKAYIMDYDLETYGKTPTFKNWPSTMLCPGWHSNINLSSYFRIAS
jgi:hypothetical protein